MRIATVMSASFRSSRKDMPKTKTYTGTVVEVTPRDISKGLTGSCRECPVALAIRRATRSRNVVALYQSCDIGRRSFRVPVSVDRFITAFDHADRNLSVKPFTFRIGMEHK